MVVSQRPSDLDSEVLSQCGTMIALRVTNGRDRAAVMSVIPDDLGGLGELLPSLRTGEALILGDALPIPSRVRIRKAMHKLVGDDPDLPAAWCGTRTTRSRALCGCREKVGVRNLCRQRRARSDSVAPEMIYVDFEQYRGYWV